jgi:hypothetical protein
MKNGREAASGAGKLAFCGLMAALGAAVMLLGGVLGVATYCAPLIASAFLIPALTEYGRGYAWLAWLVMAVISVLLSADKESAFFYVFLGYYPIIRALFLRIEKKPLRIAAKLLYFALAAALLYLFLCLVLKLDAVLEDLGSVSAAVNAVCFAVLVALMLGWDYSLGLAENLYLRRIRPHLRSLR